MSTTTNRPLFVTIIAIGTILAILDFIKVTFLTQTPLAILAGHGISGISAIILNSILIILNLIIVYGFLKCIKWTWWLAVVLFSLDALNYLLLMVFNHLNQSVIWFNIFGIGIYAISVVYLNRQHVRVWFGV